MRLASMAHRFDAMDDDPRLSVCLSEIAPTMNELAAGLTDRPALSGEVRKQGLNK